MPRSYDALVIGAGPAGASAAFHLASAGRRVLMVDRARFPRAKPCGDGLTPAALAAIERLGIDRLPGRPITGLRIIDREAGGELYQEFAGYAARGAGMAIERTQLDHLLLEHARKVGAELACARAEALLWRGGRAVGAMLRDGEFERHVEAAAVIVAIGSKRTGTLLDRAPARQGCWSIAARCYVDVPADTGVDFEFYAPLREQRASVGYAWIFPVAARTLNVGVGLFRKSGDNNQNLRRLLCEFLAERSRRDARLRGATARGGIESGPIFLEPWDRRVPGLLPVGDFAGLANPLTAEGIGPAIESGELAAAAMLSDESLAAERYLELLHSRFASRYRLAPALRSLYEEPWMYLGRGADVVTRPNTTSGEALRRLYWDEPATAPHIEAQPQETTRAVDRVRREIVDAVGGMRPLLAELTDRFAREEANGFGVLSAFGTVCGGAAAGLPSIGVWKALEMLNLITLLHGDMRGEVEPRAWGGDTLNLLLADCLNAMALGEVSKSSEDWARCLAQSSSNLMRLLALRRGGLACSEADLCLAWHRLFRAAALAGRSPHGTLPSHVEGWALRLSRARARNPIRLAELWRLLALAHPHGAAAGQLQTRQPPRADGGGAQLGS